MDLYEYQGKQYFARFGIPTSTGSICDTVEEAVDAADSIGYPVTIKAQVQVGGRGKAGGVKPRVPATKRRAPSMRPTSSASTSRATSSADCGSRKTSDIAKEYYVSFTLDRAAKRHLCNALGRGVASRSSRSQMSIQDPEAIARLHINPLDGISIDEARALAREAEIDAEAQEGVAEVLVSLYRCYVEGDADLVEVNPLILTPDGRVHALDAKVTLDDSAAFRHPEWDEFRGLSELDHRERLAKQKGLQYVGLDGNVGIIANGAGLAMSTCDVVAQVGGEPANFLDIGGGANADQMANALEVISTDEKVRSIFINIFGGITRGEEVANGIVQALGRVTLNAPIVVRLDGTNAEEGRAILAEHESDRLVSKETMLEAASDRVVEWRRIGGEILSIFVDEKTKVVIQGVSPTSQGLYHGLRNRAYGTQVVAGTNPRRGRRGDRGHPRLRNRGGSGRPRPERHASFIAVPPSGAPSAILEAAEAGISFIVCITEFVPAQDEALVYNTLQRDFPGTRLLGPNCPGIISAGQGEHRHHLGRHRARRRSGRTCQPVGDRVLPGSLRAHPAGDRSDDRRRDRR